MWQDFGVRKGVRRDGVAKERAIDGVAEERVFPGRKAEEDPAIEVPILLGLKGVKQVKLFLELFL